jgi:hypothetical protein
MNVATRGQICCQSGVCNTESSEPLADCIPPTLPHSSYLNDRLLGKKQNETEPPLQKKLDFQVQVGGCTLLKLHFSVPVKPRTRVAQAILCNYERVGHMDRRSLRHSDFPNLRLSAAA